MAGISADFFIEAPVAVMSARIISTGPGLRKRLSEIARGLDKAAKVRIGFLENATTRMVSRSR